MFFRRLTIINNREKILGISAALVIAISFCYVGILEPQIKNHRNLQEKLSDLKIQYLKMQKDVLMSDRIENSYEQTEPLLNTTDTEQQQTIFFTKELSDILSEQNIEVRGTTILLPQSESSYTQLALKFEIIGNIKELLNLAKEIESLNKPICIESFDLYAQDATDFVRASIIITKIVKVS